MNGSSKPRRVSRRTLSLVTVVALAVSGGAIYETVSRHNATTCAVQGDGVKYTLDADQAINATTIAAVGKRIGLPDHAVTVALAAALQESNLHNLAHGDRDSLGLFQQRPSQGWGTASQVQDPVYASTAFFTHLARVDGWENLAVTTAAQEVQRSSAPDAYAQWTTEARALARATTGEVPAAFTCHAPVSHASAVDPGLRTAINTEIGPVDLDQSVTVPQGWLISSWLVAHARRFGITAVTFDGRRWTRSSATWQPHGPAALRVGVESGTAL